MYTVGLKMFKISTTTDFKVMKNLMDSQPYLFAVFVFAVLVFAVLTIWGKPPIAMEKIQF